MNAILYSSAGLVFLVFCTQIKTGDALNCYQCNSTTHAQCLEVFDHEHSTLKAEKCLVADARYCVKVSGAWGSVVGTYRFCSSRDMGNQCQYFGFEDHDRHYRACVRTCETDDCNPASRAQAITISTLILGTFSWLIGHGL